MATNLAAAAMGSCDACGWAAAFMSMLGFGSFGAPIKSEASKSVDIDPLVFQSYKTFMCFITSWLVLLFGVPFSFTPWGIVSACFWVPSGVAAIAGIKLAGLAVAMGTLSSFIVLVSFSWGIFFFDEQIHSRGMACLAIGMMMAGLVGMSYYSSLENDDQGSNSTDAVESCDYVALQDEEAPQEQQTTTATNDNHQEEDSHQTQDSLVTEPTNNANVETTSVSATNHNSDNNNNNNTPDNGPILVLGQPVPRRVVGIACAMFCGVWGGSIMAPEKLAKPANHTSGVGYLISFSIGAAIVTLALWMARFGYHYARLKSATSAYQALPSFHIRVMWLPGCTAGALWSMGNFFSLISVKYLGEGVGYSVTQSGMLVSGLWGIFYFKEVTGGESITKWFISASVTLAGILLLSYEHHEK